MPSLICLNFPKIKLLVFCFSFKGTLVKDYRCIGKIILAMAESTNVKSKKPNLNRGKIRPNKVNKEENQKHVYLEP